MAKYQPGTFVTVPNLHLLKGQPSDVQSVFQWICSHSNKNGVCFPSRTTLSNEAGCCLSSVDKAIEKLINLGILQKTTRKQGKANLTSIYQILINDTDDDLEIEGVPCVAEEGSVCDKGGVVCETKRELNPLELKPLNISEDKLPPDFETFIDQNNYVFGEYYFSGLERNEEGYSHPSRKAPFTEEEVEKKYKAFLKATQNKENYLTGASLPKAPFNSEEEINKLKNSSKLELQIIGLYLSVKGFELSSRVELDEIINRNFKTAKALTSFKGKITGAMKAEIEKAQQQTREKGKPDYEWKLTTILKHLT